MILEKDFYKFGKLGNLSSDGPFKLIYDDDSHQFVLFDFDNRINIKNGYPCYVCPYQLNDNDLIVMLLERDENCDCIGQYLFYFRNDEYNDYKIFQFPKGSMIYSNWFNFIDSLGLFPKK